MPDGGLPRIHRIRGRPFAYLPKPCEISRDRPVHTPVQAGRGHRSLVTPSALLYRRPPRQIAVQQSHHPACRRIVQRARTTSSLSARAPPAPICRGISPASGSCPRSLPPDTPPNSSAVIGSPARGASMPEACGTRAGHRHGGGRRKGFMEKRGAPGSGRRASGSSTGSCRPDDQAAHRSQLTAPVQTRFRVRKAGPASCPRPCLTTISFAIPFSASKCHPRQPSGVQCKLHGIFHRTVRWHFQLRCIFHRMVI